MLSSKKNSSDRVRVQFLRQPNSNTIENTWNFNAPMTSCKIVGVTHKPTRHTGLRRCRRCSQQPSSRSQCQLLSATNQTRLQRVEWMQPSKFMKHVFTRTLYSLSMIQVISAPHVPWVALVVVTVGLLLFHENAQSPAAHEDMTSLIRSDTWRQQLYDVYTRGSFS